METREIRAKGYTKVEDVGASMKDSTTETFINFKNEVTDKLDKMSSDIHSLKIALGRIKSTKEKNINITEK